MRYAHVADSCIDCGQCEELCPMEIPNARFMHAIEADLEALYGYHAGEDMSRPIIAIMEEPEKMPSILAFMAPERNKYESK